MTKGQVQTLVPMGTCPCIVQVLDLVAPERPLDEMHAKVKVIFFHSRRIPSLPLTSLWLEQ